MLAQKKYMYVHYVGMDAERTYSVSYVDTGGVHNNYLKRHCHAHGSKKSFKNIASKFHSPQQILSFLSNITTITQL